MIEIISYTRPKEGKQEWKGVGFGVFGLINKLFNLLPVLRNGWAKISSKVGLLDGSRFKILVIKS